VIHIDATFHSAYQLGLRIIAVQTKATFFTIYEMRHFTLIRELLTVF